MERKGLSSGVVFCFIVRKYEKAPSLKKKGLFHIFHAAYNFIHEKDFAAMKVFWKGGLGENLFLKKGFPPVDIVNNLKRN